MRLVHQTGVNTPRLGLQANPKLSLLRAKPNELLDTCPARNIHLLVDVFPPGPQYHPSQPYMKEDDEN